MDKALTLIFVADIVLTFYTPYYSHNELVTDKRKISSRYVCSIFFYIDIITLIPFDLFFDLSSPKIPFAFRLASLPMLYRLVTSFLTPLDKSQVSLPNFQISKKRPLLAPLDLQNVLRTINRSKNDPNLFLHFLNLSHRRLHLAPLRLPYQRYQHLGLPEQLPRRGVHRPLRSQPLLRLHHSTHPLNFRSPPLAMETSPSRPEPSSSLWPF